MPGSSIIVVRCFVEEDGKQLGDERVDEPFSSCWAATDEATTSSGLGREEISLFQYSVAIES